MQFFCNYLKKNLILKSKIILSLKLENKIFVIKKLNINMQKQDILKLKKYKAN